MALVTDSKEDRAIKEQQAARDLQQSFGRAPTQTEIYQKTYGSAYPVFSEDYGTPKLKERLDKYAKNVYGAAGNIRKGVLNKAEEARYQEGLEGVFAEGEYDPLRRKQMIQGLQRQRTRSQDSQFNQRYNQYAAERGKTLFDYNQALGNQNQALQGSYQAELADLEYQRQLEKEQRDFEKQLYLKSLTRSSGPSAPKPSTTLTPGQIDSLAGIVLDNYKNALSLDPGAQIDFGVLPSMAYGDNAAVAARVAQFIGQTSTEEPAPEEQVVGESPFWNSAYDVSGNVGNTLQNTVGQGFGDITNTIGSGLQQGVETVAGGIGDLIDLFRN